LALPGMTDTAVDRFLELRRGEDGLDGTKDDGITSVDQALRELGLSQQQAAVLKTLQPQVVGFKDQFYRVVSVGRSSDARRTVQYVFRRAGVVPQLITWKEF